jgi:YD repeat-containing protein
VTQNTYDAQNNLTSTTDPLNHTTYYGYDSYGHRNAITNALGETTHFSYDSAGKLYSKSDALGNMTSFDYDSSGHRTKVVDALGHITTICHDIYGRPIAATNALNQLRATAGSDSVGNLQFVQQAGGLRMDLVMTLMATPPTPALLGLIPITSTTPEPWPPSLNWIRSTGKFR